VPRFYFHLRQQDGLTIDDEGCEARDASEAWDEGIEAVREVLVDAIAAGVDLDDSAFECADEEGGVVFSLPLRMALH
jgi:hypothetical protein